MHVTAIWSWPNFWVNLASFSLGRSSPRRSACAPAVPRRRRIVVAHHGLRPAAAEPRPPRHQQRRPVEAAGKAPPRGGTRRAEAAPRPFDRRRGTGGEEGGEEHVGEAEHRDATVSAKIPTSTRPSGESK
jgi:hypothetical protein